MPQNKRESLIYTVMMCFVMVLWMSFYNVVLQQGRFTLETLAAGWLGFPFAYVVGMCCDWFVASRIAKGVAFRFLVKPQDSALKKILCISCGMVVVMVVLMSLYGACEGAFHTGNWAGVPGNWLEEKGYTYPTVMDETGEIFAQYGISAFPTTFMIDADGNVFGYITGSLTRDIMDSIIEQTRTGVRAE